MKSSILIIYTGGTIGMKADPADGTLKPFNFSQIKAEVPELRKFDVRIDSCTFDPLIDSSDIEPSVWVRIARLIRDRYAAYDGFVILHGTDTMAYSASALSFMLKDLSKPVIFTGSQLPIGTPRTDGKENLISAVEIASAKDADGHSLVPEVSICFGSRLLRGNRSTKYSAEAFDAFISPNCPPLAEAGITIRYNADIIRRPSAWDLPLTIFERLDTRVAILKLHPGITPAVAGHCLCADEIRACIIETYGSGNALSSSWFTDLVCESAARGKVLVNISQCKDGEVNMDLYATGAALKRGGVLSGKDMTTEAALAKLFVLMGLYEDNDKVKEAFQCDLRGEISK